MPYMISKVPIRESSLLGYCIDMKPDQEAWVPEPMVVLAGSRGAVPVKRRKAPTVPQETLTEVANDDSSLSGTE